MSPTETVKAMLMAVDSGDLDGAANQLAENLVFSGPVPEPIGKTQWVHVQSVLLAGLPDWSFNLHKIQAEGNLVTATYQITGTHTGELDLSPLGLPKIPATGKSISLPEEQARCTVEAGKIVEINIDPNPAGGVTGILNQLGVEIAPPG